MIDRRLLSSLDDPTSLARFVEAELTRALEGWREPLGWPIVSGVLFEPTPRSFDWRRSAGLTWEIREIDGAPLSGPYRTDPGESSYLLDVSREGQRFVLCHSRIVTGLLGIDHLVQPGTAIPFTSVAVSRVQFGHDFDDERPLGLAPFIRELIRRHPPNYDSPT